MTPEQFQIEFKPGDKITDIENPKPRDIIRIMAIVEGWVVARRTGAIPFVRHLKDFTLDANWRKYETNKN